MTAAGHFDSLNARIFLYSANFFKFLVQRIHKERVDYLVDILDAGVVHSALAPRLRVQCGFKNRAEDCRRNLAPVERGAVAAENVNNFLCEVRNLNFLVFEKSAVHVRKWRKRCVVFVALFNFCVQCLEKVYEREPYILQVERAKIVLKCGSCGKKPRVLGIEAEHEPHAKNVERARLVSRQPAVFALRNKLFYKRIVHLADKLSRGKADFLLASYVLVFSVNKEFQTVEIFCKVFKENHFRRILRIFHVVDVEFRKVAHDNPSGLFACLHVVHVAFRLLVRRENRSVRLPVGFFQVDF